MTWQPQQPGGFTWNRQPSQPAAWADQSAPGADWQPQAGRRQWWPIAQPIAEQTVWDLPLGIITLWDAAATRWDIFGPAPNTEWKVQT
jgi:hypothetical protein